MQETTKESFKNRYQVINRISEGNFGCVYKALDTQTSKILIQDQLVALKKLFVASRNQKQRLIIEREVKIMQSLKHPNIIKLLNYKLKETSITLVLEYCPTDLANFLEQIQYPIQSDLTKQICFQILNGIAHIHSSNIIHRDLKPQNILISDEGIIKIGDFGSATFNAEEFEIEGFTRWYKSPEQLFGSRTYNASIDIWAFGCIMVEIIQGFPLFTSMNEIEQISKIAEIIGSPDEKHWGQIVDMPDFGKISFQQGEGKGFGSNLLKEEKNFIDKIIKYQDRLTAKEALQDSYFEGNKSNNINQQDYICFEKEKFVQNFDYTKIC